MIAQKWCHVLDLPQLYTQPEAAELLQVLSFLEKPLTSFENDDNPRASQALFDPAGVPRYLTGIISSNLRWIQDDSVKEAIWDAASIRLSERSGRSAARNSTRSFLIDNGLSVTLHEPALTEDSLGLKTWTSSLMLAKRLKKISLEGTGYRVLELGAGTGLVGLAAAFLWRSHVDKLILSDLPEIVPNLKKNIEMNQDALAATAYSPLTTDSMVLDWSWSLNGSGELPRNFDIVLAADPIYDKKHPQMLVETVKQCISSTGRTRFIVELPLREAYSEERAELRQRLEEFMEIIEEGEEVGYDDWEGADGRPMEVICWWSIWKPMT